VRRLDTIVLHHSASKAANHTWEDIRKWHLARGWNAIGYHFGVVFDSGQWLVKPGRPIEQVGAHAKGFNAHSVGICFEGNFSETEMPPEQFALGVSLISTLLFAHPTIVKVVGHRDLPYPTECPGKLFPFNQMIGAVHDVAKRADRA
jgi:hypothetical protein